MADPLLSVKIIAETSQFVASITEAEKSVQTFTEKLKSLSTPIVAAARRVDSLSDVGGKLQKAFRKAGIDGNNFKTSLASISQSVQNLGTRGLDVSSKALGGVSAQFTRISVSANEMRSRLIESTGTLKETASTALGSVPRLALVSDSLKNAGSQAGNFAKESAQKLNPAFEKISNTASATKDSLDKIPNAARPVKNVLAAIAPAATQLGRVLLIVADAITRLSNNNIFGFIRSLFQLKKILGITNKNLFDTARILISLSRIFGSIRAGDFARALIGIVRLLERLGILTSEVANKIIQFAKPFRKPLFNIGNILQNTVNASTLLNQSFNLLTKTTFLFNSAFQGFVNAIRLASPTLESLVVTTIRFSNTLLNNNKAFRDSVVSALAYYQILKIGIGIVSTFAKAVGDIAIAASGVKDFFGVLSRLSIDIAPLESFVALTTGLATLDLNFAKQFATESIAAFAEFESGIIKVSTLFLDLDENVRKVKTEELSAGIRDLTRSIGNSVSDAQAAAAAYEVFSAFPQFSTNINGISEALRVLRSVLQLTAASGVETQTAADAITKTLTAFSLSAGDASTVGAKFLKVVQFGQTEIPKFAAGIGSLSNQAGAVGASLDETLGALAALTTLDDTSSALVGLEGVFRGLLQLERRAKNLGVEFTLADVRSKGLVNTLQNLFNQVGQSKSAFQQLIPDARAYNAALALIGAGSDKAREATEAISKTTSELLDKTAGLTQQGFIERMTSLVNGFRQELILFGESLQPAFNPAISLLEGLLKLIQGLPAPIRGMIAGAVALALALANFNSVVGITVKALGSLAQSYLALRLVLILMNAESAKVFFSNLALLKGAKSLNEIYTILKRTLLQWIGVLSTEAAAEQVAAAAKARTTGFVKLQIFWKSLLAKVNEILTATNLKAVAIYVSERAAIIAGIIATKTMMVAKLGLAGVMKTVNTLVAIFYSQVSKYSALSLIFVRLNVAVNALWVGFNKLIVSSLALSKVILTNVGLTITSLAASIGAFLKTLVLTRNVLLAYNASLLAYAKVQGTVAVATSASTAALNAFLGKIALASIALGKILVIIGLLTFAFNLYKIAVSGFIPAWKEVTKISQEYVNSIDEINKRLFKLENTTQQVAGSISKTRLRANFIDDFINLMRSLKDSWGLTGLDFLDNIKTYAELFEQDIVQALQHFIKISADATTESFAFAKRIKDGYIPTAELFADRQERINATLGATKRQMELLKEYLDSGKISPEKFKVINSTLEGQKERLEDLLTLLDEYQEKLNFSGNVKNIADPLESLRMQFEKSSEAFKNAPSQDSADSYFSVLKKSFELANIDKEQFLDGLREIIQTDRASLDTRLDAQKTYYDTLKTIRDKTFEEERTQLEIKERQELARLKRQFTQGIINKKQLEDLKTEVEDRALEERIQLLQDRARQILENEKSTNQEILQARRDLATAEDELLARRLALIEKVKEKEIEAIKTAAKERETASLKEEQAIAARLRSFDSEAKIIGLRNELQRQSQDIAEAKIRLEQAFAEQQEGQTQRNLEFLQSRLDAAESDQDRAAVIRQIEAVENRQFQQLLQRQSLQEKLAQTQKEAAVKQLQIEQEQIEIQRQRLQLENQIALIKSKQQEFALQNEILQQEILIRREGDSPEAQAIIANLKQQLDGQKQLTDFYNEETSQIERQANLQRQIVQEKEKLLKIENEIADVKRKNQNDQERFDLQQRIRSARRQRQEDSKRDTPLLTPAGSPASASLSSSGKEIVNLPGMQGEYEKVSDGDVKIFRRVDDWRTRSASGLGSAQEPDPKIERLSKSADRDMSASAMPLKNDLGASQVNAAMGAATPITGDSTPKGFCGCLDELRKPLEEIAKKLDRPNINALTISLGDKPASDVPALLNKLANMEYKAR